MSQLAIHAHDFRRDILLLLKSPTRSRHCRLDKDLFHCLEADADKGLSREVADRRLAQYGENALEEKRVSPLVKFLSYFWGPIPWMIEVAGVLAAIVHEWADFSIIVIMLLVNALVGFWQEFQADNAIALLKQRLAPAARVLRDGNWQDLPAKLLGPGDIDQAHQPDEFLAMDRLQPTIDLLQQLIRRFCL